MAWGLETNIIAHTGRHPQTRSPKVLAHCYRYFGTGYLGVLGDLNHSNPFVRQTLLKWVREMVQNYSTSAASGRGPAAWDVVDCIHVSWNREM